MKKYRFIILSILLFNTLSIAQNKSKIVSNVQIKIYLSDSKELLATCTTNSEGRFSFTIPRSESIKPQGTFELVVTPHPNMGADEQTLYVDYLINLDKKVKSYNFSYYLIYTPNPPGSKTINRGSFAVSGKSSV